MKTKREILAAILQGDTTPLLEYRNQQEACIYVFNGFSSDSRAYCIYPDFTIETIGANVISEIIKESIAKGKIEVDYHELDLEAMEIDLQNNPAKYYKPQGLRFFV